MTYEAFSILSKVDQPSYGIRQIDGSWKILSKVGDSQDLFTTLEKLILNTQTKKYKIKNNNVDYEKLISGDVANYLSKYHPHLKFVDVSISRDFILFSQIQAQNINPNHWKGGNAGSVHFDSESAKRKAIAEAIERTALSYLEEIIWASAVAPNYEQAELNAKFEAIERWVTMEWWQENPIFKISEDIIPYLPQNQKQLFNAILFEWEPYHAHVRCLKIFNPFGLEIVLAIVDAFVGERRWRFYGNGLDKHLFKALEKACVETLQFIPGPDSQMWAELERRKNENDQRIFFLVNLPKKSSFF